MKCPFLVGKNTRICTAVRMIIAPSNEDLDAYCMKETYKDCPLYEAYMKSGHKLNMREYCEIDFRHEKTRHADY